MATRPVARELARVHPLQRNARAIPPACKRTGALGPEDLVEARLRAARDDRFGQQVAEQPPHPFGAVREPVRPPGRGDRVPERRRQQWVQDQCVGIAGE